MNKVRSGLTQDSLTLRAPSAARLRDWNPPTWRIRIGSWRIFYEIDDEKAIVFITAADHRKAAYR